MYNIVYEMPVAGVCYQGLELDLYQVYYNICSNIADGKHGAIGRNSRYENIRKQAKRL